MSLKKDKRSQTFFISSLYVGILFILSLTNFNPKLLNYLVLFGFFILTVYNIESIIQVINSRNRKKALAWLLTLYIVSLVATTSLNHPISVYYEEAVVSQRLKVDDMLELQAKLTYYKNFVLLLALWGRSIGLLGLVKAYVTKEEEI